MKRIKRVKKRIKMVDFWGIFGDFSKTF